MGFTYLLTVDTEGRVTAVFERPVFEWSVVNPYNYNTVNGTWTRAADSNFYENIKLVNSAPHNQNDAVCIGHFYAETAEEYTFKIIVQTGPVAGIIHVMLNNVDKAQIDNYAADTSYNVIKTVSLGDLAVGQHTIVLKVATKHASASAYRLTFTNVMIAKI